MKSARGRPPGSSRKRPRSAQQGNRSSSKSRAVAVAPSVSLPSESGGAQWTFLSNHAHVLALLPRSPSLVLREVALQVGITERAVQRIIADLEASGIIDREKIGRQNHYRIRTDRPLRHPIEAHRTVGELLALINGA